MKKGSKKEIIEINSEEVNELKDLIQGSSFPEKYKAILLELLNRMSDIRQTAKEKASALQKLKRILGNQTEKIKPDEADKKEKDSAKTKGHGRIKADDYKCDSVIEHPHHLEAGQKCPQCEQGSLHCVECRKIIRLIGQAPISAELHKPEVLRCSTCGVEIVAAMPDVEECKLTSSANSVVAVARFGFGLPNWRLAKLQDSFGVPLPASTQHEMLEMAWLDASPIFNELLRLGSNGSLFNIDDTKGKILSLMLHKEERKSRGERVGIYTTGIVSMYEGHEINLFFTGSQYSGENLDRLLDKRDPEQPLPQVMADASSMNIPKLHAIYLFLCLVHGRREFIDCYDHFPDECGYVIQRIAEVYLNEKTAKSKKLNPDQRLLLHQEKSSPLMEEIRVYATEKLEKHEVEPNSSLGGAFSYLLKFWEGLTQFLKIPGAPLDNNAAERLLKKMILCRKNSLFYKTENGARIGDGLMSIIHTTIAAQENPFEYLTVLQKYSRQVAAHPELWLPWNFRKILKSVEQKSP